MSVGHVAARVSHVDEQGDASALSGLMGIRPQVVFLGSRPRNRPRTDPPGDPGPRLKEAPLRAVPGPELRRPVASYSAREDGRERREAV